MTDDQTTNQPTQDPNAQSGDVDNQVQEGGDAFLADQWLQKTKMTGDLVKTMKEMGFGKKDGAQPSPAAVAPAAQPDVAMETPAVEASVAAGVPMAAAPAMGDDIGGVDLTSAPAVDETPVVAEVQPDMAQPDMQANSLEDLNKPQMPQYDSEPA